MDHPIRWKQRFDNFERAYQHLVTLIEIRELRELSDIEKIALIQVFEFTFELAWKTLKDYLEEQGYNHHSPKNVLRQAFQSEYISNGELWMEALRMRNLTAHAYDQSILEETAIFIFDSFFPLVHDWYYNFKREYK